MRPARTVPPTTRFRPRSWKAEGIGRSISAFQVHLVRPQGVKLHEKIGVEFQAAVGFDIGLHHPTLDPIRIELLVPGSIQGVGKVYSPSIATQLDHLGSAVQRLFRARMRGTPHDATNLHRPCKPRLKWV